MNRSQMVITCLALASCFSSGCASLNNTEKGGLIGAGVGAGLGTAIGAATGNPKTGAVAGTLLGGGLGSLAGHKADEREGERAAIQQASAEAAARQIQMGLIDVVSLVQQGVDAEVIVNQIRSTGSTFNLSTKDIEYLASQNVPTNVIRVMQDARYRPSALAPVRERVIVRETPVYVDRPSYPVFIGPPPPPPVYGFHYSHVRVR